MRKTMAPAPFTNWIKSSVPTSPELAQNYWWIRGRSAFMTGHPVEGTRALVEREHGLTDPAALRTNREELYNASDGRRTRPILKHRLKPIVSWQDGWNWALSQWKSRATRCTHGAATTGAANTPTIPPTKAHRHGSSPGAVATEFPDQVALLLPLSGRSESVGVAVRDGFIAAYLQQDAASRPQLKVYDVAAESVASAYNKAVADGAGFIVGPLTKEDVAAIVPLSHGQVPVLALNFLGDNLPAPR